MTPLFAQIPGAGGLGDGRPSDMFLYVAGAFLFFLIIDIRSCGRFMLRTAIALAACLWWLFLYVSAETYGNLLSPEFMPQPWLGILWTFSLGLGIIGFLWWSLSYADEKMKGNSRI